VGTNIAFSDLPIWAIVAVVVIGAIQLTLQIVAILHVLRTPPERLRTGRPWVWILVIAAGIVGVAIYFAVSREQAAVHDPARAKDPAASSSGGTAAADVLYGEAKESTRREDGTDDS
jgi:hypothetical protein